MANTQDGKRQEAGATGTARAESDKETGDPGRTPGKAEGDEETVDENLKEKGMQGED